MGARMTELQKLVKKYYLSDFNCAETLLHACNDYYQLDMKEEDIKVMAGFGGGMFVGSTCGALVGSIASISKKVIEVRAHQQTETFRPLIQKCVRNFKEDLGAIDCAHVKPVHHTKETKCLNTCLLAAKAIEKTLNETVDF